MQIQAIIVIPVLVCIFVKWLIDFVRKCRAFPPGPWGMPLVGYVPWMSRKPHEKFWELAQKYGRVFSLTLGTETVVVLNDWPSIREALVDQAQIFKGRPKEHLIMALSKDKDVAFSDGPVWQKQRRLMLRCLRGIGMGKKSMESRAMDLVHDLLEYFKKHDGEVLPMQSVIFGPLLKLTWSMVADTSVEEAKLKEFEQITFEMYKAFRSESPINLLPWLRFVPPNGFGYWEAIRVNEKFLAFIKSVVDKHVANWNEGALHDFVDFYMADIKANAIPDEDPEPPYDAEHLLMSIWILFLAGVETTNSTCQWGFLFLAYHPEVQRKLQAEMDEVVGRDRLPTLDDIPRLPYLEAVVMEIHRKASLVPLSLPHKTSNTATIAGYTFPKGTTFFQNIYAVHNDPTLWDEPELFKPERFINEDNVAKTPPFLIPFSLGPRLCVGQAIANLELTLIFGCVLHQFSFSLPPGKPKPSLEPEVRLTLQPRPYSLSFKMRKH